MYLGYDAGVLWTSFHCSVFVYMGGSMNYMYILGMLMIFCGGALLHDVPFLRFLPALMLVIVGFMFVILGSK